MISFQGGLYFVLRTTRAASAIVPEIRSIVRIRWPHLFKGALAEKPVILEKVTRLCLEELARQKQGGTLEPG